MSKKAKKIITVTVGSDTREPSKKDIKKIRKHVVEAVEMCDPKRKKVGAVLVLRQGVYLDTIYVGD